MASTKAGFSGTERFVVTRHIGAGGMGIVYEVVDTQRDTAVALKTLRRLDPQALYRFKREFRALQDLQHENLVSLGELFEKDGDWFFTMELIDGDDFHAYVRTRPIFDPGSARMTTAESPSSRASAPSIDLSILDSEDPNPGFDEPRLRTALIGMARGLMVLHAAGKVHRDVKPSNVMIDANGRVVLLDFGLISEPGRGESMVSVDNAVVGTPAYMSPEQGMGKKVTAASDCYSLGAMMYEALTGRLPFHGTSIEILSSKQSMTPTPPNKLTSGIDDDLNDLCMQLLAIDPDDRPTAIEVLDTLAPRVVGTQRAATAERDTDIPFVGRTDELRVLTNVYKALDKGGVHAVLVRGGAGIGKSRLIGEFVRQLRQSTRRLVVLNGRCFEHEDIAFKATDSLVDQLSHYWASLASDAAAALLPREASYLPRIFPVLQRVGVVADSPAVGESESPNEIRHHAFAAFREVLQRLGDRKRLVLIIDNIQWVDPDSVNLLSEVLHKPDAPNLMLVLAARTGGGTTVETDGELPGLLASLKASGAELTPLDVGPLARAEAKQLGEEILGRLDPNMVARLATESQGSPFFLVELARYLETELTDVSASLSLEEMVARRFDAMSEDAQLVLGIVVSAGEPVRKQVVAAAASLSPRAFSDAVDQLRKSCFVRAAGGRATDQLEPYHDRIRVLVAAAIREHRARKYHRNLAQALEKFGGSPERLARHYLAAGENEKASLQGVKAAKAAMMQFDYNRAARLYQLALSVGEFSQKEQSILMARTGEALAYAGFGLDAAAAYADAAAIAEPALRLECHRRRAEQLLISGHVRLGQQAIGDVLEQIGLTLPRGNRSALLRLFRSAARLKLRGLGWTPRRASDISEQQLTRVDACWSAITGLVMSSFILGPVFSKTGLLLALQLGEPLRVARHAATEALLVGMAGKRERAERLIALGTAAATEHGSDQAHFYSAFARSMLHYNAYFKLGPAVEGLEDAYEQARVLGLERSAEGIIIALFACLARMYRGDLPELDTRARRALRMAEQTGNKLLQTTVVTGSAIRLLAKDDVDSAIHEIDAALESWIPGATDDFDQTRVLAWMARLHAALYVGDADAYPEFEAGWDRWRASPWRHAPVARNDGWFCRGRFALQVAAQSKRGEPSRAREALANVQRAIKTLRKQRFGPTPTTAALLDAGAARIEGNDEAAIAGYRKAADLGAKVEMHLHANAARYRLGQLIGGDEGAHLCEQADAALTERGVVDPARFVRIHAPTDT